MLTIYSHACMKFYVVQAIATRAWERSFRMFVRSLVRSFVCSFVRSFVTFRHVRRIYLKVFG